MPLSSHGKIETHPITDTVADATVEVVNATTVLYGIEVDNTQNNVASYLKMWHTASPTVGTTAPNFIFRIPAGEKRLQPIGDLATGYSFATVMAYAVVTDPGTGGTTAPTNDVEVIAKTD